MAGPTVDDFMTPHPHTVGKDQTMSTAHRIMRDHNIRHLPVLESGKVVGVVTERDLHLMETLKDVNPDEVLVEDAMSPDPYNIPPGTPLRVVADEMGKHKYGCAIITRDGRVHGVFTTVDACRALVSMLKDGTNPSPAPAPAKAAAKPARKAAAKASKKAPARKAAPARRSTSKAAGKRGRR